MGRNSRKLPSLGVGRRAAFFSSRVCVAQRVPVGIPEYRVISSSTIFTYITSKDFFSWNLLFISQSLCQLVSNLVPLRWMSSERRPVKTDPNSIDSSDSKKSVSNSIDCLYISEQQHTKYVCAEHLTEIHTKHKTWYFCIFVLSEKQHIVGHVGKSWDQSVGLHTFLFSPPTIIWILNFYKD